MSKRRDLQGKDVPTCSDYKSGFTCSYVAYKGVKTNAVVFTGRTDEQARYRLVPHQVPDDAGAGNPISVLGRQ